jgi:hypothetical protein
MNYVVEMGTDAMMYIPSFMKNWLRHSKVDTPTHRREGELIILLFFFQNKESRLKIRETFTGLQ